MTTAQVVENVNNRQQQSYSELHPLGRSIPPTYEITPGFNLFTVNVSQFNMFYRIAIFSLFFFTFLFNPKIYAYALEY